LGSRDVFGHIPIGHLLLVVLWNGIKPISNGFRYI